MRYADASALVKLVIDEDASLALRRDLGRGGSRVLVTSMIARTEVGIAIARRGEAPAAVLTDDRAYMKVRSVTAMLLGVAPEIAQFAARLGADLGLKSLDAIHVATAASLGPRITEVITYDRRMVAACTSLGLRAVSPGS